MALQLLYAVWREDAAENSLLALSEGLEDADRDYLLSTAFPSGFFWENYEEDEENEERANTLFLHLPSGRLGIARLGLFQVLPEALERGAILHAYIAEAGESVSPMLYAINNCFRISLTPEERKALRDCPVLPKAPFPRPQFKLSQPEIRKFFSAGRVRTLACLLQAVIDSYGNERIILLNDRYSSLKYWFYGIHCCLPRIIKEKLTYSTYAYSPLEECKLICGAAGAIDGGREIEAGNFVFDNMGGAACEDVESAKYARSIAALFWEDASAAHLNARSVGRLMEVYHLTPLTAAGILKLLQQDFNWFDSPYDLQFFLGKVGILSKMHLESLSELLWERICTPGFPFPLGEKLLPLIAYLFKNLCDQTKEEVVCYIGSHRLDFGIADTDSYLTYYELISDKIGFILEYLIVRLVKGDKIERFDGMAGIPDQCALLYRIIDNLDRFIDRFGCEAVYGLGYCLVSRVIEERNLVPVLEICKKSASLSKEFLHRVIVQAMLDALSAADTDGHPFKPSFVFAVVTELVGQEDVVIDLVKMYARNGQYNEEILELYYKLCQDYPAKTEAMDKLLQKKPAYAAFMNDMAIRKFLFSNDLTREKLTVFFDVYYLAGKDQENAFETKLSACLKELYPVRRIELAEYFLLYFRKRSHRYAETTLAKELHRVINEGSVSDIFDYYANDPEAYRAVGPILSAVAPLSAAFEAAGVAIELWEALSGGLDAAYSRVLYRFRGSAPYGRLLSDEKLAEEWLSNYSRYLFRFWLQIGERERNFLPFIRRALLPLAEKPVFEKQFYSFLNRSKEGSMEAFCPLILASIDIFLFPGEEGKSIPNAAEVCSLFLCDLPFEQKKIFFQKLWERGLPLYSERVQQDSLRGYLSSLYYSKLSGWQRFRSPRFKKLLRFPKKIKK